MPSESHIPPWRRGVCRVGLLACPTKTAGWLTDAVPPMATVVQGSRAGPNPTTDKGAPASTHYAAYGGSSQRASADAPPTPAIAGNQDDVVL